MLKAVHSKWEIDMPRKKRRSRKTAVPGILVFLIILPPLGSLQTLRYSEREISTPQRDLLTVNSKDYPREFY